MGLYEPNEKEERPVDYEITNRTAPPPNSDALHAGAVIAAALRDARAVNSYARTKPNRNLTNSTLTDAIKARDSHVRLALRSYLKSQIEPNTLIVDELALGCYDARVDVATINGALHGFEIKAEADTLKRLVEQRDIYNTALDKVTLVVDVAHLNKALALIPRWWGVLVCKRRDADIVFVERRKPRSNPLLDHHTFLEILWRAELRHILRKHGIRFPVRSSKLTLRQLAIDQIPFETLHADALNVIQGRRRWREENSA